MPEKAFSRLVQQRFEVLMDDWGRLCYKLVLIGGSARLDRTGDAVGGPSSMTPAFDIFRTEADGSVTWCEAADTLDAARKRARELADSTGTQHVILNQKTGERTIVDATAATVAAKRTNPAMQGWYHICRVDKEKLRWVEAAETLQVAESRIKVLKAFYPGDYLVLDYNPERNDSASPWTPLSVVLSAMGL